MIIGLTGDDCSGAGLAASYLKLAGARLLTYEDIYKMVLLPGSLLLKAFCYLFGDGILKDNGYPDFDVLIRILNGHPKREEHLNLLHPVAQKEINKYLLELKDARGVVYYKSHDIINKDCGLFDLVVVVNRLEHRRIKAIMERRGLNMYDALSVTSPTGNISEKIKVYKPKKLYVIQNDSTRGHLRDKTEAFYKKVSDQYA
jgi:dephospho-CoA kinase